MGKVNIIVKCENMSSEEMKRLIHEQLNEIDLLPDYHEVEVSVEVPTS